MGNTRVKKPSPQQGSNAKKKHPAKRVMAVIGTTLLSLILVIIITGSIVVTALTVYVMNFFEDSDPIDLGEVQLAYTSVLYATNNAGEQVEVKQIHSAENRTEVKFENISQYVKDAAVYGEDERFWEHEGVDWKRTVAATANMVLHFWNSKQGGSTITQQLIKNITGDKESEGLGGIERKITEIFRATTLERHYTKQDILEAYLNNVPLDGNNIVGIQAGAEYYFGKDAKDLGIAESACLVAITKSPYKNNPLRNPEDNLNRRKYVLGKMLEFGSISKAEYESAITQELVFARPLYSDVPVTPGEDETTSTAKNNWFIDAAIEEIIQDLMSQKSVTREEASSMLYQGGYKVYLTMNTELQDQLEAKYRDRANFSAQVPAEPPESAFVLMDYEGNVIALAGGIGEKSGDRIFVRATQAKRSIGSTIKPLAGYGLALENNQINWSTVFEDSPVMEVAEDAGGTKMWPANYSRTYSYKMITVQEGLYRSLNTTAARVVQLVTPRASFDFLRNRLGVTTLVEMSGSGDTDIGRGAPMTVGGLTEGMKLTELAAAYAIFGNGGTYYTPRLYTKVIGPNGETILQKDDLGTRAISRDTSYVMNRLLRQVVTASGATGTAANLSGIDVIGKTGTTTDNKDSLFVGMTPNYVGAIWYGYDTPKAIPKNTYDSPAKIWSRIIGDIAKAAPAAEYPVDTTVVQRTYCKDTGLIANTTCTNTAVGYYRRDNVPSICPVNHNHESPTAPVKAFPFIGSLDIDGKVVMPQSAQTEETTAETTQTPADTQSTPEETPAA